MTEIEKEAELVRAALVREIRDAKRWDAVMCAWQALTNVRRLSEQIASDAERLSSRTGSDLLRRAPSRDDAVKRSQENTGNFPAVTESDLE